MSFWFLFGLRGDSVSESRLKMSVRETKCASILNYCTSDYSLPKPKRISA